MTRIGLIVDAGSTPAVSTIKGENKMIKFLSSKHVSLGCAAINVVIAAVSVGDGSWGWAAISAALAVFCYNNYLTAK